MPYLKRGPVTRATSIFHTDGTVSVPISSNRWNHITHVLIDQDRFHLVEERYINYRSPGGTKKYGSTFELAITITLPEAELLGRTYTPGKGGKNIQLHRWLFQEELLADLTLTVDHLIDRTDNRRCAVQFISDLENKRLGKPGFRNRAARGLGTRVSVPERIEAT